MQYLKEYLDGRRVPITYEEYMSLVHVHKVYHVVRDDHVEVVRAKEKPSQYSHVVDWHKHRRSV